MTLVVVSGTWERLGQFYIERINSKHFEDNWWQNIQYDSLVLRWFVAKCVISVIELSLILKLWTKTMTRSNIQTLRPIAKVKNTDTKKIFWWYWSFQYTEADIDMFKSITNVDLLDFLSVSQLNHFHMTYDCCWSMFIVIMCITFNMIINKHWKISSATHWNKWIIYLFSHAHLGENL